MGDNTEMGQDNDVRTTGVLLYAIVPADVEPNGEARGIGDPPGPIGVVRHGDVAALVSEVRLDQQLGRPEELRAFQRLLDTTAMVAPVLPVRFGVVLVDEKAVAELLENHHDEFRGALGELDGRVEYAVRGRYAERALLSEVVAENAEVRRLRDEVRDQPEDATRDLRIRLGELIHRSVEAKRDSDTRRVVDLLGRLSERVVVRPPTHDEDAANVALLVDVARRDEFEGAVDRLAQEWRDRVDVRLLGPLAPYDFVAPLQATAA